MLGELAGLLEHHEVGLPCIYVYGLFYKNMPPKKSPASVPQSELDARRLAARILGRLGGMAGKGESKRRPSEMCRAAVNKRWAAYRALKAAQAAAGDISRGSRAMSEFAPRLHGGVARSEFLRSDMIVQPRLRDEVQAILAKHGFPAFKPAKELMSELKSASTSSRAGVYVHAFKGGEAFYVGISVDVRKRYFQHLKNFKDIEYSTVLAVPRDKQFLLEFELIGELMRRKIPLRNLLRPDLEHSQGDIDLIVRELGDSQGISDESNYYRGPHLVRDAALERSLDGGHPLVVKHAEMLAHQLYSNAAVKVFARYIRTCIPLPALTERSFWTVTCMNKGLYAKPYDKLKVMMRISVARPEVFSAVIDDIDPKHVLEYNFYVAAEPISPGELARLKAIPGVRYKANYQESIKLPLHQFFAFDAKSAMKLLDSAEFRNAAKLHNLLLMRHWGQNTVRRVGFHNLPLAKRLFAEKVDL